MSKVMVSLPEELLAELDAEAKRRSITRSALLAANYRGVSLSKSQLQSPAQSAAFGTRESLNRLTLSTKNATRTGDPTTHRRPSADQVA